MNFEWWWWWCDLPVTFLSNHRERKRKRKTRIFSFFTNKVCKILILQFKQQNISKSKMNFFREKNWIFFCWIGNSNDNNDNWNRINNRDIKGCHHHYHHYHWTQAKTNINNNNFFGKIMCHFFSLLLLLLFNPNN